MIWYLVRQVIIAKMAQTYCALEAITAQLPIWPLQLLVLLERIKIRKDKKLAKVVRKGISAITLRARWNLTHAARETRSSVQKGITVLIIQHISSPTLVHSEDMGTGHKSRKMKIVRFAGLERYIKLFRTNNIWNLIFSQVIYTDRPLEPLGRLGWSWPVEEKYIENAPL